MNKKNKIFLRLINYMIKLANNNITFMFHFRKDKFMIHKNQKKRLRLRKRKRKQSKLISIQWDNPLLNNQ